MLSNQEVTGAEQSEWTLAAGMEQSPGGPAVPGMTSSGAGSWLPVLGQGPNANSHLYWHVLRGLSS